MYKLFLCLRYLLYRRIAIVPILAVMLCVAMDLIVVSIMGGFLDAVRGAARGLFGDVIVSEGSLAGFGYYDAYTDAAGRKHPGLLQFLARVPQVKQATPQIESYAMLRLPRQAGFTKPVQVLGIIADQYARVTAFQEGLYWQNPQANVPVSTRDPERPEKDWDLEESARYRQEHLWQGPPDFFKVSAVEAGRPPIPLKDVVKGPGEPTGVIVGVRVFWPTPDKFGVYPREMLRPGSEPVQLTFLPLSAKGAVSNEPPAMKQFYLVDTSYSKIQQIDSAVAYVPFATLQEVLNMGESEEAAPNGSRAPARATRILIKLNEGVDLLAGHQAVKAAVDQWKTQRRELFDQQPDAIKNEMYYYEPHGVKVEVWQESNKEYFSAIQNQKFISLVMIGVVSLTVVALIWVIFIMIVVEKTQDIGIIKSVGGSAGGIATIFLTWAAVIGLIGSCLGGVLGWLFVININAIERWLSGKLTRLTGTEVQLFDPRAYLFDKIPARFDWTEMLWIAGSAVLAAMIGALLPAVRAGRMNPVEALRYE